MSIKLMSAVWDSSLPPMDRLVLLAYADHADDEGRKVYPSAGTVARKTGLDRRSVIRIRARLEALGIMVAVKKEDRKPTSFRIVKACIPSGTESLVTDDHDDTESLGSGTESHALVTQRPKTSDPRSHKPSLTTSTTTKEPERSARASAPRPRDAIFDAVAEITKSNPKLNASMIAKVANQLRAVDATPEQVLRFGKWWAVCDWRGLRGDLPLLNQITPLWQRSVEWDGARPKLPTTAPPRSNGRTFARGQVQYTDEQRKAAEERARRELAGEELE